MTETRQKTTRTARPPMFPVIALLMCREGWQVEDLASATGISARALRDKLAGRSSWLLDEVIAIRDALALEDDLTLEQITSREKPTISVW